MTPCIVLVFGMIFVVDAHWKVNRIISLVDFVPVVAFWCQDIFLSWWFAGL